MEKNGRAGLTSHRRELRLEPLEDRTLLSVGRATFDHVVATTATSSESSFWSFQQAWRNFGNRGARAADTSTPPSSAMTPAQIRTAYGLTSLVGDGAGQTIAIVDAYDDPNIAADLAAFNSYFGLSTCSFTKLNQDGLAGSYPTAAGTTGWSTETAMDVEWAHVIAPGASIVLVEADSNSFSDLLTAVDTARNLAGVSVISMSWGADETGASGVGNMIEYDSLFTTPSGHAGVTFLASTGDDGGSGSWPALSSRVIAVGGTSLSINSTTYAYVSESAWSGSNGGQSAYEVEPSYQSSVQSSSYRQTPDVAFDADPNTGVAVLDSYGYSVGVNSTSWIQVGGTSLSAPCWAGLIAIANQLRTSQGLGTLDGREQTLQALYAVPGSDFHDVISGSNDSYSATSGYDKVTGRGSPIANLLVPALASTALATTTAYTANMSSNPGWTFSGGQWAYGMPTGNSGDPSSGYTGSSVIGYNLSGAYTASLTTTYWAMTPAINCTGLTGVTLDFWRWLGVEGSSSDHAYVQVSNNGSVWTTVWSNPVTNLSETAWSEQTYDISVVADNQATVYVRFGIGTTNRRNNYCGWNIDDVTITAAYALPTPAVASLTPNTTIVADANVSSAGFALTVVYGTAMNTATAPTVSFPVENPAGTLTFNSAASGWTNSTTYVARFDVADSNSSLANIDVRIAGGKSPANITQTQVDFANDFSIDTLNPSVTINLAASQITPTTASPINFTVVFSESVADFTAADVVLGGTAGATTAVVTGGGTTYNVAVSGMTAAGTVTAVIAAGSVHDAAGNAGVASTSTSNTAIYDPSPATVESVVVNDGSTQRSKLDSLTVTFSKVVTLDVGAMAVTKTDAGGAAVTVAVTTSVVGGKTVATLAFSGSLVEYGSLVDGAYLLTINGDKVHSATAGTNLDGDKDGQFGGDYVFGAAAADLFFRKFGDYNGDDAANSTDLAYFKASYLNASGYQWYFDFDGDGDVDSADFYQFKQRFSA